MLTATSTEVKNHFGEFLEKALQEPVVITKTGRKSAVILSMTEYERLTRRLEALEDQYWIAKAEEGKKSGFIGPEATIAFLQEMTEKHAQA